MTDDQLMVLSDKMGLLRGYFMPVSEFNDSNELNEIKVYPIINYNPKFGFGVELQLIEDNEKSRQMIEFIQELSGSYGTNIDLKYGTGCITL